MTIDENTLIIAGIVAAALLGEMRLLRRELKVFLAAIVERSRRRDARARRESDQPIQRHTPRSMQAVPDFAEEEDTDIHVLMEIEREKQRKPRGERPPRPGTHHDKK